MEIGEIVATKNSGICRIISKEMIDFGVGKRDYFVLKPLFVNENDQTKVFIPIDNNNLIRPIMKKEEVLKVIDEMPNLEKIWFSDQKIRKNKFEEIYNSGDIYLICQMIKSLYLHNEELKLINHSLSMIDRDFLNKLREGVYQEFAVVLDIAFNDVDKFIAERIG